MAVFDRNPLPPLPLIALVDIGDGRRQDLVSMLAPYYRLVEYGDGDQAVGTMARTPPDLAMVDERASSLGGYELVKRLRGHPELAGVPVILVAGSRGRASQDGFAWSGADRLLVWPFRRSAALRVISELCCLPVERMWNDLPALPRQALKETVSVFNGVAKAIEQGESLAVGPVVDACSTLVDAINHNQFRPILEAVKGHDNYTYVHCLRVSVFLSLFGYITGLSKQEQLLLASGGLLQDAGKIRIPYDLLNKPGSLTADEYKTVQAHVPATVALLRSVPDMPKPIVTIAGLHHERLDGSGYPQGVGGESLDELARMAAIVDVFGALTDRRTYKSAVEPEAALKLMADDMSAGLDMRLLSVFRQVLFDAAVFGPTL